MLTLNRMSAENRFTLTKSCGIKFFHYFVIMERDEAVYFLFT